jgi:predicted metalloprotease with PDZ domain
MVSKAVLLLQELDREIRLKTRNKRSLDDVLQGAMRLETVDTEEFVKLSESVLGGASAVLDSRLLQ